MQMMTEREYNMHLTRLERARPYHPLLPKLRAQYTFFNTQLLMTVIKKVDSESTAKMAVPAKLSKNDNAVKSKKISKVITHENVIEPDSVMLRSYNTQLRKLFTMRARLSNSFHLSTSRDEDLHIAEQVVEVQNQIKTVMDEKDMYLSTKELPPQKPSKETFEIPTDPYELQRMLSSVGSSLSHRKRELKKIDKDKDPKKYSKKLETIDRLTKHKMYLEQEKRSKINK